MNTLQEDAILLNACGYSQEVYPPNWEECGDAENGPSLDGHPGYTEWMNAEEDHFIIVDEEEVIDFGKWSDTDVF